MKKYKSKRHYFANGGEFDSLYSTIDLAAPGVGTALNLVNKGTQLITNSNMNEWGLQGNINTGEISTKDNIMGALGGFNISNNINNTIDAFDDKDYLRGIVGLANPFLGSMLANQHNMKEQKTKVDKERRELYGAELFNKKINDMNLDRNKYGMNSNVYAAMGANVPAQGGQLAQIGTDYIAQGASHEQGGIQLANAEIEGGEIVRPQPDGSMQIDSKRLGTAQINIPLVTMKDALLKKLQGYQIQLNELNTKSKQAKNRYSQGSVERQAEIIQNQMREIQIQLATIEQQLQSNFQQQQQINGNNGQVNTSEQPEMVNQNEGQPIFALGGENDGDETILDRYEKDRIYSPVSIEQNNNLANIENIKLNDEQSKIENFNKKRRPTVRLETKMTKRPLPTNTQNTSSLSNNTINTVPALSNNTTSPTPIPYTISPIPYANNTTTDIQIPFISNLDAQTNMEAITPINTSTNPKLKMIDELGGIGAERANLNKKETLQELKNKGFKIAGNAIKTTKDNSSGWTPYIDNVGNAILNRNLRKMQVPPPNYRNPLYLETDYNIDNQLARINQNSADFNTNVNNTIGNSAVANAYRLANMKNQTDSTINLVTDKLTKEMAGRNQLSQLNNQIDSGNKALKDAYDAKVFEKKIRTDYTNPSQNLANIEENIKDARGEKNLKQYQQLQLAMMKEAYHDEVAGAIDNTYLNNLSENDAEAYINKQITSEKDFRAAIQQVKSNEPAFKYLQDWAKRNKINGQYYIDNKLVTIKNGEIQ